MTMTTDLSPIPAMPGDEDETPIEHPVARAAREAAESHLQGFQNAEAPQLLLEGSWRRQVVELESSFRDLEFPRPRIEHVRAQARFFLTWRFTRDFQPDVPIEWAVTEEWLARSHPSTVLLEVAQRVARYRKELAAAGVPGIQLYSRW